MSRFQPGDKVKLPRLFTTTELARARMVSERSEIRATRERNSASVVEDVLEQFFGIRDAWTEGLFLISSRYQNYQNARMLTSLRTLSLNVLTKRRGRWFGPFPVPFRVFPNSFLPVLRRVQRDSSGNLDHGC
jgi:hypothetical protein